jgi:hypothetical protein
MKRNSKASKATLILAVAAMAGGVALWMSKASLASDDERVVETYEAQALGHISARNVADLFPAGR